MNIFKRLAGQTAIYGLSSIIGRFLNYLLVPLHTSENVFSVEQYGIISEMYAYVAFLIILLTYGMETAYFRFSSKAEDKKKVFSTAVLSLAITSTVFILLATVFAQPIASWLLYPNHQEYVIWFAIIVGLDALTSIPLARLRELQKPAKFAFVTLFGIAVNIGLNLFFLLYCMPAYNAGESNFLIDTFYNPDIGVGYVFIANLVASIARFVFLLPDLLQAHYGIDIRVLRPMLKYAWPMLIAGLAGMVNEMIDTIMLKRMLYPTMGEDAALYEVGIYRAFYKLALPITLFIQAFRYAWEPFTFSHEKEDNAKETFARVTNYLAAGLAVVFLGVMLYMDVFRVFIRGEGFWESNGVKVVPILLIANICLGLYYAQSLWYKLTSKTIYGSFIAIGGAIITIILNYALIPVYGFVGSAWATLACYAGMMIASYFLGQKHYGVPYNVLKIIAYVGSAFACYLFADYFNTFAGFAKYALNSVIFIAFVGVIFVLERPKKAVL